MINESKSIDILGLKPVSDSINKITTVSIDSAAAFLRLICRPAAEEFGLLLQDNVRSWRALNLAKITKKGEKKLDQHNYNDEDVHAHPRIVFGILDKGSWNDDDDIQDFWAGLLASSCTIEGNDDSNLIFIKLLSDLTKLQACILNYVCKTATKLATSTLFIYARSLTLSLETLIEITGETDIQRLDRELDHLREIGLIKGGFNALEPAINAEIEPSALALHMFVRCQGSRKSPIDYFGIQIPSAQVNQTSDEAS